MLDYYKAVSYMCAYLSKSEDESSEAMKQAAREAYESGKPIATCPKKDTGSAVVKQKF